MNINIVLNALIHILILILLFSFFINNKNDTNSVIFILSVTVVFICYLLEFVKHPTLDELETISKNNTKNTKLPIIENFNATPDLKIGPYDGIELSNKGTEYKLEEKYQDEDCKWKRPPCNVPLVSNVGWVTPTGIEGKIERLDQEDNKDEIVNYNYKLDLNLPSVSGKEGDPNAMFMFAYNQAHPDCCPSTFSTSTGCICTTQEQRDMINKRGGNRSKRDIYPAI